MTSKDFEKRKKAIWASLEKEAGFPLAQRFRGFVEREEVGDPKDYIDGDPEGEESYLESLQSVSERYVEAMRLIIPPKGDPSYSNKGEQSKPKKMYRKCFERRFYLVDFVEVRGRKSKTQRIDWKRTVMAWNKAHPSDTMSLPVLKAEYYRAMREVPLILQYGIARSEKVADAYRQLRRLDNTAVLKEDYDEFVRALIEIHYIRKRTLLEQEKQLEEVKHERSHNQEVQE